MPLELKHIVLIREFLMVITTVKDINGSPHIAIPPELLEQIQLPIGSSVSINIEGNQIMIAKSAPHYSLDELLAGMPDDLILSSEEREWLEVAPVGRELW
jgi:antitoxin component of MazEF toxin-antitoxin module